MVLLMTVKHVSIAAGIALALDITFRYQELEGGRTTVGAAMRANSSTSWWSCCRPLCRPPENLAGTACLQAALHPHMEDKLTGIMRSPALIQLP